MTKSKIVGFAGCSLVVCVGTKFLQGIGHQDWAATWALVGIASLVLAISRPYVFQE